MLEPEDFASLAADFRALAPSQQREVRGSLTTFERIQFDALLNGDTVQTADEESDPLGPFSPWLREQIRGDEQDSGGRHRSAVTPHARLALVELAREALTDQPVEDFPEEPQRRRSLLGSCATLFSREQRP